MYSSGCVPLEENWKIHWQSLLLDVCPVHGRLIFHHGNMLPDRFRPGTLQAHFPDE